MSAPLRHISAIRDRLIGSPDLVALVPATQVYLSYIFGPIEVAYPCIALSQVSSNRGVWAPYVLDPAIVQVDMFTKGDTGLRDVATIAELVDSLLHNGQALTSNSGACVAQIRRIWGNTPLWQEDVDAWRMTFRYNVHVFNF